MKLSDDCLMIPIRSGAAPVNLAGVGPAQSLTSVLILDALDHPHKAGEGQESSMVLVIGPGISQRREILQDALEQAGAAIGGKARELELRAAFDASRTEGNHMVAVCVDFRPTTDDAVAQEDQFDRWYSYEHMGDISRADGIHRAFRGAVTDDGPRRYWCWYQTDDPAVFMDSRKGQAPWGGLWLDNIDQSTFRRSYFVIADRWNKE